MLINTLIKFLDKKVELINLQKNSFVNNNYQSWEYDIMNTV